MKRLLILLVSSMVLAACTTTPPANVARALPEQRFGVMVMAHGGGPAWNVEVEQAVAALRAHQPTEIAFGMADAATMEAAVRRLEAQGATDIGVVRLFVSGDSFLTNTRQILGLTQGAPEKPANTEMAADGDHHHEHAMNLWRIDAAARFELSEHGLLQAEEVGVILRDRADALSRQPERERVLILGHGPASDEENARWLAMMKQRAAGVRELGFSHVQVETLREDWPESRELAERRIRDYVEQGNRKGERVLVIPFRVAGFGPYRKVLEGLDYDADGKGFLPHPKIGNWLQTQADHLRRRFYGDKAMLVSQ